MSGSAMPAEQRHAVCFFATFDRTTSMPWRGYGQTATSRASWMASAPAHPIRSPRGFPKR